MSRRLTALGFAIIYIAACAGSITARAQNTSESIQQQEQAERQRINGERASLKTQLEKQRQACYQKLAVTSCLNEARDLHNDKMRDLKRQEVALNDVQRKRAAADRVGAVDERNSPQAQQNVAERRGRAMAAAEKREEDRAQRERSREAKLAGSANASAGAASGPDAAASKTAALQAAEPQAAAPQGQARVERPAKKAADEGARDAAKMARSRQQAAAREKAAAERRAKAQEREAKRKKPAAKPLAMPVS